MVMKVLKPPLSFLKTMENRGGRSEAGRERYFLGAAHRPTPPDKRVGASDLELSRLGIWILL